MRCFLRIPLLCFLLAGCGMPEYEKRMDTQRARVTEFDETNRLLDDPLEMSMSMGDGKVEQLWRVDFFLRLPKGFGTTPKDKMPYYKPFPCYRYAGADPSVSILLAANLLPEPKGREKLGEYHNANFRAFVRLAIADYYFQSTKLKLNLPEKEKGKPQERMVTAFGPYPATAPKLKYEFVSYTDLSNKAATTPSQFDVYLHEAAGKQVCIVVQHPIRMQNAEAFTKNIEACLGTLDATAEATSKRAQFKRGR